MTDRNDFGLMRLYHPSGVQVSLPIPVGQVVESAQWASMLASVSNAIAAGWLQNAPGLEEGEERHEVGYVVHKVITQNDNEVDVIDLYSANDGKKFSILTVYLDSDEKRKQFEAASGMSLSSLPIYEGDNKIERDKDPTKTKRYVIKAPKPFYAASKLNPRYDADEAKRCAEQHKGYMVARRKFSSWPGLVVPHPAASASPPVVSQQENGKPDGNTGASEPMLRKELVANLKQLAALTKRTVDEVTKEFCATGRVASLEEFPASRLGKACDYLALKINELQCQPTPEEIGDLSPEVLKSLMQSLADAGINWVTVRKCAIDQILGRPVARLTLDDCAKIDNWARKQKAGKR